MRLQHQHQHYDRFFLAGLVVCLWMGSIAPAGAELVAWFDFEDDLADATGNPAGLNGTFHGGTPSFGPGSVGQGIVFDGGDNNAVTVPINLTVDMTPAVTIGAWVRVSALNGLGDGVHTIVQSDGRFARKIAIDDRGTGNLPGTTYYTAFFGTGLSDDSDGAAADRIPTTKPVDVANDGWVFVAASYDGYTATGISMAGTSAVEIADVNPGQASAYSWLNIGGLRTANGAIFEEFIGGIDNVFVLEGAATQAQLASIRDAADPFVQAQAVGAELDAADPTRSIKLDLQSLPGGAFGSGSPVAAAGILADEIWNALTTQGLTAGAVPGSFPDLDDTDGSATGISFAVTDNVGAYNVGGANNHGQAGQDGWVYGNFSSPDTVDFVFSGLDPDATYRLTPIGSWNGGEPAQVSLDSDGDGTIDVAQFVRPFAGARRAIGAGAYNDVPLVPDASGQLVGAFTSVAATNSIGGLILDEFAPANPSDFRVVEWRQTGRVGDIADFYLVWNSQPGEEYRVERSTDARRWSPVTGAEEVPSQGLRTERMLSFDTAAHPRLFVRVVRN